MNCINWWVDASFAVHPDCKSHTGASVSFGKGCPINMSTKQKINTRSSTEAELVGMNDALTIILWLRNFIEDQGYTIKDNIIHQDNMSTILLANNGRKSSGKKTRHIDIRYYFITDNIHRGKASIVHCPTEDMIGDFFTKPLQGLSFRKLRGLIMNYHTHDTNTDSDEQECVEPHENLTMDGQANQDQPCTNHSQVKVKGKNISQDQCNMSWVEIVKSRPG